MQKRRISCTDIDVSPICLGTMTFGSPVCEAEAVKLVHYALESGINFIDTANMYEGYTRVAGSSGGVAEDILGKALKGIRNKVILATKVGMKVGSEPEDEGTSAAAIKKHLDISLKRMKTDVIDIYYLHKYDQNASLSDSLYALQQTMEEGKIRYYGISNYNAEQLSELLDIADSNGLPRPVICQPPLSLLKQDALYELIPLCAKENISVAPYQVLQGGLLTGKYKRNQPEPEGSRKAEKSDWVWELTDELYDKIEDIQKNASEAGLSMTQFAIRWVARQMNVVSAIVGVKRKEQIDEAVNSF